jgi:hypothetical protein
MSSHSNVASNRQIFYVLPDMIVYRDLLSGDEMITDAFKLLPVVDKEGATVREN